MLLKQAKKEGRARHIGRRVREDGRIVLITAVYDQDNEVVGFTKLTRELMDNEIS